MPKNSTSSDEEKLEYDTGTESDDNKPTLEKTTKAAKKTKTRKPNESLSDNEENHDHDKEREAARAKRRTKLPPALKSALKKPSSQMPSSDDQTENIKNSTNLNSDLNKSANSDTSRHSFYDKALAPRKKINQTISFEKIEQILDQDCIETEDKNLFNLLIQQTDENKIADFNQAFNLLSKLNDSSLTSKISGVFIQEIYNEHNNISIKHLPLLTEQIHRYLFKIKIENQDKKANQPNGSNTRRGLALSEEITHFKWGNLLGGLGKLLIGGVIVTIAVVALLPSFGGSAVLLSSALMAIGIHAATPTAIAATLSLATAAPTAGVLSGLIAAPGVAGAHMVAKGLLGKTGFFGALYDYWAPNAANKVIAREANKIYDDHSTEVKQNEEAPASPTPGKRSSESKSD